MKFQLLKPGDRFIYQDEVYVKSTPLVAIHEVTGETRLIPRSALLKQINVSGEPVLDKPTLDEKLQTTLKQSSENFIQGLDKILSLTESERQSIQQLYEDTTTHLINNR